MDSDSLLRRTPPVLESMFSSRQQYADKYRICRLYQLSVNAFEPPIALIPWPTV